MRVEATLTYEQSIQIVPETRSSERPSSLTQLEGFLTNDEHWNGLRNQRSGNIEEQFDNFPDVAKEVHDLVRALREDEVMVKDVFNVAYRVARSSTQGVADEPMRFDETKEVTIQLKRIANRVHGEGSYYEDEDRLRESIDRYYSEFQRPLQLIRPQEQEYDSGDVREEFAAEEPELTSADLLPRVVQALTVDEKLPAQRLAASFNRKLGRGLEPHVPLEILRLPPARVRKNEPDTDLKTAYKNINKETKALYVRSLNAVLGADAELTVGGVRDASIETLEKCKGIGPVIAIFLKDAFAGRRNFPAEDVVFEDTPSGY